MSSKTKIYEGKWGIIHFYARHFFVDFLVLAALVVMIWNIDNKFAVVAFGFIIVLIFKYKHIKHSAKRRGRLLKEPLGETFVNTWGNAVYFYTSIIIILGGLYALVMLYLEK